jgi:hypothetical protein
MSENLKARRKRLIDWRNIFQVLLIVDRSCYVGTI